MDGAHDLVLYRYQAEVAGYQTIRFKLRYGAQELSDLSEVGLNTHIGPMLFHQLAASGKLG